LTPRPKARRLGCAIDGGRSGRKSARGRVIASMFAGEAVRAGAGTPLARQGRRVRCPPVARCCSRRRSGCLPAPSARNDGAVRVVRDNLETLYGAIEDGALSVRIPKHARKELDAYLDCGLLCRGFARLRCGDCGETRLVAFR
jgi:hypothetical protein